MVYEIINLDDLREFVADRPVLKSKVEEVLKILDIQDYKNSNKIIQSLSVFGGTSYYLDNGKSRTGAFIRTHTKLQEIEFTVKLLNNIELRAKVIQKLSKSWDVKTSVYYSEGFHGGPKGKKHFCEVLDKLTQETNNGTNPFKKELDNYLNNLNICQSRVEELRAEIKTIADQNINIPISLSYLKRTLSNAEFDLSQAIDKTKEAQDRYDDACVI